jgi:hypothetical protein
MRSSDKAKLYGVPSTDIDVVWGEVVPYLEKTLARADGKFSIDDIYSAIEKRDMQLWVIFDKYLISFIITQIIFYPQYKILTIPYVGGVKMPKWVHFYEQIAAFGKANGCKFAEGYARDGWLKVLKRYGFKKSYSVISAPI